MKGDGSCGYYAILSQCFFNQYEGDTLGPGSNNYQAKIDINSLKESAVQPYLQLLKSKL
jgi:hypothetical protein